MSNSPFETKMLFLGAARLTLRNCLLLASAIVRQESSDKACADVVIAQDNSIRKIVFLLIGVMNYYSLARISFILNHSLVRNFKRHFKSLGKP